MSTLLAMDILPTLDAHGHIDPDRTPEELKSCGAVLAMTLSLEEAARALNRNDPLIAWGVGCYPKKKVAQENLDLDRFKELTQRSPIIGEIGLDSGSPVPIELQIKNFRHILELVKQHPRILSIHSYRTTGLVLDELSKRLPPAAILHWWTGSAAETSRAVELGCFFSIHSAVARHSKFRTRVPPGRILLESDHGYNDPPPAIPCRVQWVEYLVAQQYRMQVQDVRRLAWQNLTRLAKENKLIHLFPLGFQEIFQTI